MDKKSLKREYKGTPRPMGVYQIKNLVNGKILIGSSKNLPGIINRIKFQLKTGTCQNEILQAEWRQFGPGAFEFKVIELFEPLDDSACDADEDLKTLEALWIEKLMPYNDRGYNRKYLE